MLDPTSPTIRDDAEGPVDQLWNAPHGETIVTILWRFRWLFCLFIPLGIFCGYAIHRQKPMTYRATTQLMFKSDKPLSLDSTTGMVIGGIPSGKLMTSLVRSEAIVERVVDDKELRAVPALGEMGNSQLITLIRKGIRFQTVTDQKDARDRMIAEVSYDGEDAAVCAAAVNAVSRAIGEHFHDERETTIDEFGKLIENAQNKLIPQQTALESEYQAFRETAPLVWDPEGKVVNPHRQEQFRTQAMRIDLLQEVRELSSELRLAASSKERYPNPLVAARVIGSRSNRFEFVTESQSNSAVSDLELKRIEVEKSLVPLEIKLEQLREAYGISHPEVRSIATQIRSTQQKLNQLNQLTSNRHKELDAERSGFAESAGAGRSQVARARDAIDAYIGGLMERLRIKRDDLAELDQQIAIEKARADELKKAEDEDASFRRRIASLQGMLFQLEQQLSALNLVDINGGIIVQPLVATGKAHVTGPDLSKNMILSLVCALAAATVLAVLLEASAKTFRSGEEIQRVLQLPVLTHIPQDDGRIPMKGFENPAVARLDPKLSVIHRPYSPAAESIRGVRTAITIDRRQFGGKVFQVTSPLPGDGKSTIAANLGCAIAQTGKRILLVDLDLRSPKLSLRFNLETKVGLTNVLNGEMAVKDAVHEAPIENLDILPCGPLPSNPAEALTLSELSEVFQWARDHYDFIIVDTPPLLMVSDPTIVTTHVDAAILATRIRRRCRPNAKEAVAMLRWSGTRVLGVVVNKLAVGKGLATYRASASGSYQSIGYGYGDKYRRRYQQEVDAHDTYLVKGRSSQRVDDAFPGDKLETRRPHMESSREGERTDVISGGTVELVD